MKYTTKNLVMLVNEAFMILMKELIISRRVDLYRLIH